MTVNKYSFVIGWCVLFDEENPLIFVTKCSIWMFSRVVTYDLWYTWNSWIIVWNKKCRVKNERKIKYWIQTISTKQYIVNRTSMYCVFYYSFRHKKVIFHDYFLNLQKFCIMLLKHCHWIEINIQIWLSLLTVS